MWQWGLICALGLMVWTLDPNDVLKVKHVHLLLFGFLLGASAAALIADAAQSFSDWRRRRT